MAVLVCIPTNSVRGFPFSTPSPAFITCRLLDSSHFDWREMVSHCGFDLHFSDSDVEHLFLCLYVFFGEMSVWFFGSFFDWVIYFSGTELQELLVYF